MEFSLGEGLFPTKYLKLKKNLLATHQTYVSTSVIQIPPHDSKRSLFQKELPYVGARNENTNIGLSS